MEYTALSETVFAGRQRKNAFRMEKRRLLGLPRYTLGEEIFSSISHGVSAVFAVAALVFLLVTCQKTPLYVVSAAVYGGTMVMLYTVSTLYHGLGLNRAKVVFRSLDHCTIFLLIAGTYTPITLVCLGGWKGWAMFGAVWAAAVVGVVLNAISVERFKKISMACYLAMGWVVVLAMGDFYRAVDPMVFGACWREASCIRWERRFMLWGKKCPICIRCSTCSCWAEACSIRSACGGFCNKRMRKEGGMIAPLR